MGSHRIRSYHGRGQRAHARTSRSHSTARRALRYNAGGPQRSVQRNREQGHRPPGRHGGEMTSAPQPEGWRTVPVVELISISHGFAFKGEYFSTHGKDALATPGNFIE